ncbi:hypothetical protein [Winogradskyella forsetii]|uniref:hypothetical protein n=1 Tax=Winogradskyella forsetii TaxID=2686077 RepID=UPI0015C05A2B|nr:hypothetical protein [Winogradskyella forsetii]
MRKIFKVGNLIISVVILILFVFGCDDVLEEDLTNDMVSTTAPTSGQIITSNSVLFQWNALDGADDYTIQVENNNNVIILDSLVPTNSLEYPLGPGAYAWRVRGENFAYQTAYTFPVNFTIEASDDLTNQTIFLNTPTDNYYTNSPSGILTTWSAIATADSYTFELDKQLSGNTATVYQESDITNTSHTIVSTFLNEDAEYVWKVKAINDTTVTETEFASRSIFLDTSAPNTPALINPADNAIAVINTEVVFSWDTGTDLGSINAPLTHILEIATNTAFTNAETYSTSLDTQSITFLEVGDYYWRVKTNDDAGNQGVVSTYNTIVIN